MPAKLTNDMFLEKCRLKHGDRWDYSMVNYHGSKNKVTIICKEHGEFTQTASDHLSGCGCPHCDTTKRMTTEEFISKSKSIHGDSKWDYSKVKYGMHNYEMVEIICEEHGSFMQRPWAHLRGQGCPKCVKNSLMTNSEFIEKCKLVHGTKWDYSKVNYMGRRKEIDIICKKHGVFKQIARIHLEGYGCKLCKNSKMEDSLLQKLVSINEPYEKDKKFNSCRNKNPLPFDFYLPLRNILIECDGIQHHQSVEHFGGDKRLEYQKSNDSIKTNWAKEWGIKLIRLTKSGDIDEFIKELVDTPLIFNKSHLKDLNTGRVNSKKNQADYLMKTDFNWYRRHQFRDEIRQFLNNTGVNFIENKIFNNTTLDFSIDNISILLIDNFRDSEINKRRNWLSNLKTELESIDINLICIYPEDWFRKCEITKSRIKNALRINDIRIGARECKIVELLNNDVWNFLEENHIGGKINSSVKIGLEYKGEIVSVMTFGKLRRNLGQKSVDGAWELLRFCNKRNYTVTGSANKLFNYFKKNWKVNYILSYADRCWTNTNNNVYDKIGMKLVCKTEPSYTYLVGANKWDRFKYRKDRLIELGYDKNEWTERSICSSNGVFKIWDAGCLKYELFFESLLI